MTDQNTDDALYAALYGPQEPAPLSLEDQAVWDALYPPEPDTTVSPVVISTPVPIDTPELDDRAEWEAEVTFSNLYGGRSETIANLQSGATPAMSQTEAEVVLSRLFGSN